MNRRQTQECKEYVEAGDKYLDCQDRQLTTVMQGWPTDINHLLLGRNKIQVCAVQSPSMTIMTPGDMNNTDYRWLPWQLSVSVNILSMKLIISCNE